MTDSYDTDLFSGFNAGTTLGQIVVRDLRDLVAATEAKGLELKVPEIGVKAGITGILTAVLDGVVEQICERVSDKQVVVAFLVSHLGRALGKCGISAKVTIEPAETPAEKMVS